MELIITEAASTVEGIGCIPPLLNTDAYFKNTYKNKSKLPKFCNIRVRQRYKLAIRFERTYQTNEIVEEAVTTWTVPRHGSIWIHISFIIDTTMLRVCKHDDVLFERRRID